MNRPRMMSVLLVSSCLSGINSFGEAPMGETSDPNARPETHPIQRNGISRTAASRFNQLRPGTFQLVKLDPNPVASNASFAILVRVTNARNSPLHVTLSATPSGGGQFSIPINAIPFKDLELNANETRLVTLSGSFSSAGDQEVDVEGKWQTDKSVLVKDGTDLFHWAPVFDVLGEDSGIVHVFGSNAPPPQPQFVELGPNQRDESADESRQTDGSATRSGVVGAIAGRSDALFAIPKTAGVWRSINGGAWTFLRTSPPRAFTIAVDPNNKNHVAVGERSDDNPQPSLGDSGLWESMDLGEHWTYTFDPAPTAGAQEIAAVAFSKTTSTIFLATSIGVARRPSSSIPNTFSQTTEYGFRKQSNPQCGANSATTQLGAVTAVVSTETRVWARTNSELFWSDDDGKTWDCWTLQQTVNLPGDPNVQADYSSVNHGGHDGATLAAFDDQAYVIFAPTIIVPSSDPRAWLYDARCNPSSTSYDKTINQCVISSVTAVLTFLPSTNSYLAQYTLDNDGRGAGGHRFIHAYSINANECPNFASRAIGFGRQVVVGAAQSIQQALTTDKAGRLVWGQYVGGEAAGPSYFSLDSTGKMLMRGTSSAPNTLNWNKSLHADFWDVHLPDDFCPTYGSKAFLANDGGIYMGIGAGTSSKISDMTWSTRSDGLHVQTAQMLAVADAPEGAQTPAHLGPIFFGPLSPSIPVGDIVYPTQDNDSWWRTPAGTWITAASQGDSNYVTGDSVLSQAIAWRQLSDREAALYSGANGPQIFTLNRPTSGKGQPFDGSATIQAVQTLASEPTPNSLDIVMLVQLPLPDSNGENSSPDPNTGNPVADPPGGSGSGSRMALIRNESFSSAPNGPVSSWAGWHIVNDNIPAGARRLWIGGGHTDTQYFLYTDQTNAACPRGLQRLSRAPNLTGLKPGLTIFWKCLVQNLLDDGGVGAGVIRQHGPAFVNPFDPEVILAVVRGDGGAPNALKFSNNGGSTFCELTGLEALVTESGRYALVGQYDPGVTFGQVGSAFHGFPLAVPSDISFNRRQPSQMLVSSPYTALYLGTVWAKPFPGTCKETWNDLKPALPTSRSYISSSAFLAGSSAIVSSEGRGVYGIANITSAQPATYFEAQQTMLSSGPIAILHTSDGSAVAWGLVNVTVRATNDTNSTTTYQVRSDAAGHVFLPTPPPSGTYIFKLLFPGDGTLAPTSVKFLASIN